MAENDGQEHPTGVEREDLHTGESSAPKASEWPGGDDLQQSASMGSADTALPETDTASSRETEGAGKAESPSFAGLEKAALGQESLEALLAAAEVANRIGQGADEWAKRLQQRAAALASETERVGALNQRMLIGFGAALGVAVVLFAFMSVQLSSRIAALNTTVVAVGDRVIRLSAGLQDLESLRRSLLQVADEQRNLGERQALLADAVEQAVLQSAALPQLIPEQLSPQLRADLEAGIDAVSRQVGALRQNLDDQGRVLGDYAQTVAALQQRVQGMDQRAASLARLESDLEALVTLTRERYLETLRALAAVEDDPPAVLRYPPLLTPSAGAGEG